MSIYKYAEIYYARVRYIGYRSSSLPIYNPTTLHEVDITTFPGTVGINYAYDAVRDLFHSPATIALSASLGNPIYIAYAVSDVIALPASNQGSINPGSITPISSGSYYIPPAYTGVPTNGSTGSTSTPVQNPITNPGQGGGTGVGTPPSLS